MKSKTLQVYLGWDPREGIAFDVARESIRRRTKHPIQIIPLRLKHLDFLTRPIEHRNGQMWCPISDAPMSTEFAISRFTIPFIQDHGWALFADCDIICWSDIEELFALSDEKYAVMLVKHPYVGTGQKKMDDQIQTLYRRKNWSSVVLWNCEHIANTRLTLSKLNNWPGRALHAFSWLSEDEIGELPPQWNWLVNVEPYHTGKLFTDEDVTTVVLEPESKPIKQCIWHFTLGGPWLAKWKPAAHDSDWLAESEAQREAVAC